MVECEWGNGDDRKNRLSVLIDTWWNVNLFDKQFITHSYGVLIDTWWNVNVFKTFLIVR